MAGMVAEAGIKHGVELFMALEMARDGERGFGSAAHAQVKRAQAADQEPGFEGAEHGAAEPARLAHLAPRIIGRGVQQGAGEHVAMAVEIFRRRMKNHIGAELDGAREDRRGDRRIDRQAGAGGMREPRGGGDVDHFPSRVAGRFDPHQGGLGGADRLFQGVGPCGVEERQIDAPGGGVLAQAEQHSVIHDARRDDARAGRQGGEQGVGGGEAGSEQQSRLGAFEAGQQRFRRSDRRIVAAAIYIGRVDKRIIGVAGEGDGGLYRRRHRAAGGIDVMPGLGGYGLALAPAAFHRHAAVTP